MRTRIAAIAATALSLSLLAPTASAEDLGQFGRGEVPSITTPTIYQNQGLRSLASESYCTEVLNVVSTPSQGSRLRPGTHTVTTTVTYKRGSKHLIYDFRTDEYFTTCYIDVAPETRTVKTSVHVDAVMTEAEYRKIKNGMKQRRVFRIVDDKGTVIERGYVRGKRYTVRAWKKSNSNDYATVTIIGKRARVKSW